MMISRSAHAIFLGSVLLEPNRWSHGRPAETRLSLWLDQVRDAGFSGIEVWERHWQEASLADRELMRSIGLRYIFNSYAPLSSDAAGSAARELATAAARALRAEGIKFNFSKDPSRFHEELATVRSWAHTLPPGCRLLCECHADTCAEFPEQAALVAAATSPEQVGFILHPFFSNEPARWLSLLGGRIVHWHVQVRDASDVHRFAALADRPEFVADRLAVTRQYLPPDTMTIEFTRGIPEQDRCTEVLLRNAAADRSYLGALLAG